MCDTSQYTIAGPFSAMPRPVIITLRLPGCVAELLQEPAVASPLVRLARDNFSATLRAATDAYIAAGTAIVSSRELSRRFSTKLSDTPRSVSLPPALGKFYTRYARAQGLPAASLFSSALVAHFGLRPGVDLVPAAAAAAPPPPSPPSQSSLSQRRPTSVFK